jgi:hypothetical protein
MLPDIRKRYFFERSETSLACPSDNASTEMKMSFVALMECCWQLKSETLGENRARV